MLDVLVEIYSRLSEFPAVCSGRKVPPHFGQMKMFSSPSSASLTTSFTRVNSDWSPVKPHPRIVDEQISTGMLSPNLNSIQ